MKAEFLTNLDTRTIDDKLQKLLSPFLFRSAVLNRVISVPVNFVTDAASVPRVPFVYMMVGGKAKRAACIHDFLYQTHSCRSRRQADLTFMEAMKIDGLSLLIRELMYIGVRLGGMGSWFDGPARYDALQRLQNP